MCVPMASPGTPAVGKGAGALIPNGGNYGTASKYWPAGRSSPPLFDRCHADAVDSTLCNVETSAGSAKSVSTEIISHEKKKRRIMEKGAYMLPLKCVIPLFLIVTERFS